MDGDDGRAETDLRARLTDVTLRDEARLRRRIDGLRSQRSPQAREANVERLRRDVEAAERRALARLAGVPRISYPAELPVAGARDQILAAIRDHQVVVVAGETGSGKTTQLPKICLELGRGVRGMIGHTQPRRIAARAVAERIAEELATPLGEAVGYTVRFTDQVSDATLVKVMTDGILLAEVHRDPQLLAYDTIIVDEAHERSLTIDFLLGYLRRLLPRRPDLKVVVTSATIDPQKLSEHFDGAPVVEVSGRVYPVELRYRPLVDSPDPDATAPGLAVDVVRDQTQAICEAVEELCGAGDGDILVFCSGEREIRDAADAVRALGLPRTEVLPLYARLSAAEQHRVFAPHTGRRVVLATNVAETSLTVPGIRYVVDPGTARISRYSNRTKVQRLPIEPISRASADQRKGRCGRVADGICIRLYSEEDYLARPAFTEPEILRTSLASVILQMTALGLGDMAAFPFVDPPDARAVRDGVDLLVELGAVETAGRAGLQRLTPVGRRLAQLPIDPRLGRMVLEADRNGCVREVMVIAAALSIQDPRERPVERQQAADASHARFAQPESDFLSYLALWDYLREQQKALSSNGFRRLCRAEFLNHLRVREWQDLYAQLRQLARTVGVSLGSEPVDSRRIHSSLLAGLLSHVGLRDPDKRDYVGARGARFAVFPGSALFGRQHQWVVAAELVETSRLWARIVAKVEPEWVEPLAGHLVKRTYSEPHWEKKRAAVVAFERVTLYGVPLVTARKVAYGSVDPVVSRDLFLRHALVEGDWDTRHGFFHDNRRILDELEELEHRARRRDILVDDEALFAFYDARIPADVVSGRHFDAWWKRARGLQPHLLTFTAEVLVNPDAAGVDERAYPQAWAQGDLRLRLSYQFEPGSQADGVTVHVPLPVLNRVSADGFDWQIAGLREELVTTLIRSLPKPLRVRLVPAPDHARRVLQVLRPREEPLLRALERELGRMAGVVIPPQAWDVARLPDHLRVTFQVEDEAGHPLAAGKDLEDLKAALRPRMRAAFHRSAGGIERTGLTSWTITELPRTFEQPGPEGHVVRGFPALVDEGADVAVRVLPTPQEQEVAMWAGTRRLILLGQVPPARQVLAGLTNQQKLALASAPHSAGSALFDDCLAAAADALMARHGGPAWDVAAYTDLAEAVRAGLPSLVGEVVVAVAGLLALAQDVRRVLRSTSSTVLLPAFTDVRSQLDGLVYPGFVTQAGISRLPDVRRYLTGMLRRLERLPDAPHRDRELQWRVELVQQSYEQLLAAQPAGRPVPAAAREIRWMIEELRVSFFAQTLGTAYPISEKRIQKAMDALTPST